MSTFECVHIFCTNFVMRRRSVLSLHACTVNMQALKIQFVRKCVQHSPPSVSLSSVVSESGGVELK